MDRRPVGRRGEDAVAAHLRQQDFVVLAQNARVGRLEIDLIARRASLLVFCEVKTASATSTFGAHAERLGATQQARLRRAAMQWLRAHPEHAADELRFDAAFVSLSEDAPPRIDYYAAAF